MSKSVKLIITNLIIVIFCAAFALAKGALVSADQIEESNSDVITTVESTEAETTSEIVTTVEETSSIDSTTNPSVDSTGEPIYNTTTYYREQNAQAPTNKNENSTSNSVSKTKKPSIVTIKFNKISKKKGKLYVYTKGSMNTKKIVAKIKVVCQIGNKSKTVFSGSVKKYKTYLKTIRKFKLKTSKKALYRVKVLFTYTGKNKTRYTYIKKFRI